MADYVMRVVMVDEKGVQSYPTYKTTQVNADPAVEFVQARDAFNAVLTALGNVSSAVIKDASMKIILFQSGDTPPDISNVAERALVNVHLSSLKTAPHYIHSPLNELFVPGSKTVDLTNANLVAYINALAGMRLSDGEQIDIFSGSNGMKNGRWISVPRS